MNAIGSGMDFALGALHVLYDQNISTEDKILKSLEASEFLGLGVQGPFIIINTKQ
jgi:ATP-dependent protease HslVU (ClpYQ) peptidase subunit